MKFYNQQHSFYAGVDLHAMTFYVCIIDQNGEKRLHKNFQCQEGQKGQISELLSNGNWRNFWFWDERNDQRVFAGN
jgi:hypothetical protein